MHFENFLMLSHIRAFDYIPWQCYYNTTLFLIDLLLLIVAQSSKHIRNILRLILNHSSDSTLHLYSNNSVSDVDHPMDNTSIEYLTLVDIHLI